MFKNFRKSTSIVLDQVNYYASAERIPCAFRFTQVKKGKKTFYKFESESGGRKCFEKLFEDFEKAVQFWADVAGNERTVGCR